MKIYCDGACSGNPGKGGWAAVFIKDDNDITFISGNNDNTTNNRMELTAAIMALNDLKSKEAMIFTDSTYVYYGITEWAKKWQSNNWNRGKVKNIDLWQRLISLNDSKKIKWHWIKGHSNDKYNDMADKLAKDAINK